MKTTEPKDWLASATKDELSLLLYLETRAVDHCGRVAMAHMNATDRENAQRWNASGFLRFGRIASEHLSDSGSHWCHLSDDAWQVVAEARKARAARLWEKRNFTTTEEKRAA